jgi:hypothetical protein
VLGAQVVYHWAKGVPFKEICTLTDVLEGSIVRTIVRLDETCRHALIPLCLHPSGTSPLASPCRCATAGWPCMGESEQGKHARMGSNMQVPAECPLAVQCCGTMMYGCMRIHITESNSIWTRPWMHM